MTRPDSAETETAQNESEGPDSSDNPPPPTAFKPMSQNSSTTPKANGSYHVATISVGVIPKSNGIATLSTAPLHKPSVPLPAREADAHMKEPQLIGHLDNLSRSHRQIPSALMSPPSSASVSSSDDGESWSPSSSRPPSRPSSRAPSMSTGKSGPLVVETAPKQDPPRTPGLAPLIAVDTPSTPRSKGPPSVHSDTGGQKFTLKDLLGSAPKLARKSSQRSTGSSKKSDSDAGGPRSVADSTTSLLKKYGVCEKVAIGKGATSVVRLVHKWDRSEEKIYAVKEFRKRRKNETEKEYVKKLTAEFCISSTLHHINIVETVDLVQDESLHWCEVMEFCPGGDLYAAIKKGRMSPSEVECCFKQILTGVTYLHSQGVAHRDIKPENLFFDTKGHLKIGDYGASTVYRLPWESTIHMSTGLCGSEPYIAPEQFLGKPYDARLVDIWACGIVYYCLHFQEMPWRAAQLGDSMYASYATACASANPAQSASPSTISNLSPRSCRPLIRQMLEPNPKLRWTTEQIMAHSWVQGIEVCYLSERPNHVHQLLNNNHGSA